MVKKAKHLIGAHGLFWERALIDWDAPRGQTFQLLGYRGQRMPKLQICDFRRARGVYLLFNEYGPTYVGQARGATDGMGYRLRAHDRGFKDWTRFCWFSFDNVEPSAGWPGWCDVKREENARSVGARLGDQRSRGLDDRGVRTQEPEPDATRRLWSSVEAVDEGRLSPRRRGPKSRPRMDQDAVAAKGAPAQDQERVIAPRRGLFACAMGGGGSPGEGNVVT